MSSWGLNVRGLPGLQGGLLDLKPSSTLSASEWRLPRFACVLPCSGLNAPLKTLDLATSLWTTSLELRFTYELLCS
jgi:hypothetical protein